MCKLAGGGASTEAKKPSKKVCFAARTASPGPVDEAASTSKSSAPKEEGEGDESDDETDVEESTQPCEEDKEKQEKEADSEDGGKGSMITPALPETETEAGSAMDIDDPTVAYELETDEEKTGTEEREGSKDGGEKEEGPTKGSGGAEPTVPYDLKEEDEDSDKTDVEQEENELAPELCEVTKELDTTGAASGSAKREEVVAKEPTKECSEDTDNGGDTEKVESSDTEPESQEVKEKRKLLQKLSVSICLSFVPTIRPCQSSLFPPFQLLTCIQYLEFLKMPRRRRLSVLWTAQRRSRVVIPSSWRVTYQVAMKQFLSTTLRLSLSLARKLVCLLQPLRLFAHQRLLRKRGSQWSRKRRKNHRQQVAMMRSRKKKVSDKMTYPEFDSGR